MARNLQLGHRAAVYCWMLCIRGEAATVTKLYHTGVVDVLLDREVNGHRKFSVMSEQCRRLKPKQKRERSLEAVKVIAEKVLTNISYVGSGELEFEIAHALDDAERRGLDLARDAACESFGTCGVCVSTIVTEIDKLKGQKP